MQDDSNMGYNQQVYNQVPSDKPKKSKIILMIVSAVLLIAASSGLTYYFMNNKKNESSISVQKDDSVNSAAKLDQSTESAKEVAESKSSSQAELYVSDVMVGYPLAIKTKKVLTTLYLPQGYSALGTSLMLDGNLESNYTTTFNDVVASWIYSKKGTTANPNQGSHSDLVITDLNAWQKTNDPPNTGYDVIGDGSNGYTIAQKADFVSKLKSTSDACAKDPAKGFATNDGMYKLCVNYLRPQAKDAPWIIDINGYASTNGMTLYLRTNFSSPGSSADEAKKNAASELAALKMLKTEIVNK